MASLKRHEGHLLIDHRASPGLPDVPEGTIFEAATLTCSHCQGRMLAKPDRPYCGGCDHYICNRCAIVLKVTMQCQDIRRVFDRLQHDAVHLLEKVG